jgi:hydroxymethylpyrimidine pyrophosphatase-like HAD family hydrolase
MKKLLNVNNIEAIFADIDGSTRGQKFAKKLPSIAQLARIVLNIPIYPVTGRDLNGWFLIKDYNKVFGTRRTAIPLRLPKKTLLGLGERRLYRPETDAEIKKFINRYGCIVTNNGGTISSLNGQIVFQHHPFSDQEKEVILEVLEENFDTITSIDLGNPPGKPTLHYVFNVDRATLEEVKKLHNHEPNLEFIALHKNKVGDYGITFKEFITIFMNYRTSKVLIGSTLKDTAERIVERLDKYGIEATSNEGGLAITTKGINKRTAIEWVAKRMNINLENSIFIGNDHNDTPALTIPGLGHSIFVGDPEKILNERLIKKYGNLNKDILLAETYDDLYKKLRPLLLAKKR